MGQPGGVVRSFAESLAFSHAASDWPGWSDLYRNYFPTMVGMYDHRQDGDHQRAGIDRSIVLANARQILIDEKVRGRAKNGRVYDDILLECISDKNAGTPGWVTKALRADFIAYLIAPKGVCHLLPVLGLQLAWTRNGQKWTDDFGIKEAPNRGWTTLNVPVPAKTLYLALGNCQHAKFEPWEVA